MSISGAARVRTSLTQMPSIRSNSASNSTGQCHMIKDPQVHFGSANIQTPAVISWQPPKQPSFKLNFDAAANFKDTKVGVRAVIRNYEGKVIATFSKPIQGCFKSDEMEAKALFHSLNWAMSHGL